MESLENEFRKLTVSPPNRREDGSNEPELSDKNRAAETMSPLDLFIRDLDDRKGKLPCCQEVFDIQTSVENFLKSLLLEVEKDHPFYKTTLINSGSFYEGTKVGQPDEFDYFVQLDNFSRSEDIRYEELPHCVVAVIPSESAFEQFIKMNNYYHCYSEFGPFQWKRDVKTLFIDSLNSKLVQEFIAFGLKASTQLDRHGPAYTLELEWNGGQLYKGLKIKIDLSLAVKINSHSSTMAVDFESEAGKVVKSLLHTSPYFFAVSGYKFYTIPTSTLLKEFEETKKHTQRELSFQISATNPSDCCLRCSQSCLEQSLFRHFGPDGGPSVCLRVLKVLRDMTRPLCELPCTYPSLKFNSKNEIDETAWGFIKAESIIYTNWGNFQRWNSEEVDFEPDSTRWISSYTLKTLVLFEWSTNPEDEQWTGSNLKQRIVNIVTGLLHFLKQNHGIRSFWYKDYDVLPHKKQAFLPEAINRVTIIHRFISSLAKNTKYSFEQCIQNLTTLMMMASQKKEVTTFLHNALEKIFDNKIKKVLRESIGERKKVSFPKGCAGYLRFARVNLDFSWEQRVFSGIYIQALLNKIAPEEELILSYLSEYKKEPHIFVSDTERVTKEEAEGIVKKARERFREIARKRMNELDSLPDYRLWSQDFKPDEMANLLKLLCENFKKDIEILWNEIRNIKEEAKTMENDAEM